MPHTPRFHGRVAAQTVALATLLVMLAGCYGRFPLTKATYRWNGEVSDDKYIRSIVFWPMVPIHAGAAVIDALVINVLEFWSGNRVVEAAAATQPDGARATFTPAAQGQAQLRLEAPGQAPQTFTLVRLDATRLELRDASGTRLLTGERTAEGRILLRDLNGNTLRTIKPPQGL